MSAPLPDWLTHRARSLPRVPAIVTGRRHLSYAALYDSAVRQARRSWRRLRNKYL